MAESIQRPAAIFGIDGLPDLPAKKREADDWIWRVQREDVALVFSDSHRCVDDYVELVRSAADYTGAKALFFLGDFGKKKRLKKILEEFTDMEFIGVVYGNHDPRIGTKGLIGKYDNARLIDDEAIEYKGRKIIGMGLPRHMLTTRRYGKKLSELIEENPGAMVLSHCGGNDRSGKRRGKKRGGRHGEIVEMYGVTNVYGHGHKSPLCLHAPVGNPDFQELHDGERELHLKQTEEKPKLFNAALDVVVLPLRPAGDPYYLDTRPLDYCRVPVKDIYVTAV